MHPVKLEHQERQAPEVNEEHLVLLDSEAKQDFLAQEVNQDLPVQEDPTEFQVLQEKTV